ncbi:MAG: DUF2278 family protein [Tahibacter sp.]
MGMFRKVFCGIVLSTCALGSAQAGLAKYGVVIGKPVNHYLEPVQGEGNWPHYVVDVSTPQGNYRAVINVFSRADEQVVHREVAMAPFGDYKNVFSMSDGLHNLLFNSAAAATGGALDFMRHPGVLADVRDTPWNEWPPVVGGTTVPVFDNLLTNAKRVYLFGEPYDNGNGVKGIHDVHQNQGNLASSSFAHLDGVWQDGGMVIEYAPSVVWIPRICGIIPPCFGGYSLTLPNRTLVMTHFRAQLDFTNSAGHGVTPTIQTLAGNAVANGAVSYGPFLAGQFQIDLTTLTGNPDVYIQTGSAPTDSSYRAKSTNAAGANEFLRDNPGAMTYVRVKATAVASSWNIKISYLAP